MGIPKITQGVDFNKFGRVTIDGYDFHDLSDFEFNFRHSNLSFSLLYEGEHGTVEYSFNGTTVHGDLTAGSPSRGIFFDNRNVTGIWFRAKTGNTIGQTVRIEGWAALR